MKSNFTKQLVGAAAFGTLSFLVALAIAWVFLAKQNFWYGVWHDHAGISAAIDKYGPQNRYISGFAETSREQRIRVFAEISQAIHRRGQGLAEITFSTPSYGVQKLLREPEVVHLRDVANLISFLKWVVACIVLLWAITLAVAYKTRRLPSIRLQFLGTGLLVLTATAVVLLLGPKKVFNTLHVWVFPKENAWFFYYQDSLMSTLMEAPNLFAWIAIALLAWASIFYFVLQLLIYKASHLVNNYK